jgi:hypothetical protein
MALLPYPYREGGLGREAEPGGGRGVERHVDGTDDISKIGLYQRF